MTVFNKVLAGSVGAMALALSFSGSVLADGMPSGPDRYYSPYNWGGVYIGGQAGWLGSSDIGGQWVNPIVPGNSFIAPGVDTGVVGVHAGIQHQMGNVVFGVEASFLGTLNNGFSSTPGIGPAPPIACNAAVGLACEARIADIAKFGGRLGWAYQNWMVYGTGGWAFAEITTRARTIAPSANTFSISGVNPGWFAGGGIEYGVTGNVTVGVEYSHYEFDRTGFDDGVIGSGSSRFVSTTADTVTARLTFKSGARETGPLK